MAANYKSTNSPAIKKWWGPSLHPDYEGCTIAVYIYRYLSNSSLQLEGCLLRLATKRTGSRLFPILASRDTKHFVQSYPCCKLDMLSSQPAIIQTCTVQTNGHNTASKAKKSLHGGHSVSINCDKTPANYSNTFACLCIMSNTFGTRLNLTEHVTTSLICMQLHKISVLTVVHSLSPLKCKLL